jgi:hypothetical protein
VSPDSDQAPKAGLSQMFFIGPILIFLLLVAPGVRLLSLASRTRQVPEFWGGLYFVGAAVGISMRIMGSSLYATRPELATTINTIGHLSFASGTIAMTVFTFLVFRRSSSTARILAACMIAAIVGTTAHSLLGGYASIENSYSIVATNFARLLPTCWAFYESLTYWRSMRRREALGLADPILTNRFLLWSIWTGTVTLLPMAPLGLRALGIMIMNNGQVSPELQLEWLATAIIALRVLFVAVAPIAAIALSLSFFPPTAYLDRIRDRSAMSTASANS